MSVAHIEPAVQHIEIEALDQFFNAPDADPFATNANAVLGEAALERLIRDLQLHPFRKTAGTQLVVTLPADQITPDLQTRLAEALRRYCAARIENNRLDIRLGRQQHTFGLIMVTLISLIVMGITAFLLATVFADASSVVQTLVAGGACVFVWVIMWDPLEALLFEWVPPVRENYTLRRIMDMQVIVRPQT
jgi:hypothetical protein